MNKFLSVIIILFSLFSCKKDAHNEIDLSDIEMNIEVIRFEEKFYQANVESLPALKTAFPYLFPVQNPDTIWLNRIQNETEINLFKKSQDVFGDFKIEKAKILSLFKHLKYYHKSFKPPKVITLITNLDYQNKVLYTKDFLFLSLDLYLGQQQENYGDFPLYISQNFEKPQLEVDIATAIGQNYLPSVRSRTFINLLIEEGKKMYQLDCYLPAVSDAKKMGYTDDQLAWATSNEVKIWKYFIENKLVYSTEDDLYSRFIAEAPFSKFYIEIDKKSPGKIGVWLGWQIVRSYVKNNDISLSELLETDAVEIFKKSKYKPKK